MSTTNSFTITEISDTHRNLHTPEVAAKLKKVAIGIAGSGLGGYGKNSIITESIMGRLRIMGDNISELAPGVPLMAPRVGIVANMQANAALEILLGELK